MNHIDDDGYQGMIMEEQDDNDEDHAMIKLRRTSDDLNGTAKSNNPLKVTNGANRSNRVE